MGLSGGTRKQKIPEDPRNTKWATDTSAPGFRLLSSMGWTPSAPSLGLAASQDLITAGGSRAFSKKISVIPIAKEDNLGIGARRGGGGIGVRAMGVPMMLGGMGFVTAAPVVLDEQGRQVDTTAATTGAASGGGEFGRLLERLNRANTASAATSAEQSMDEGESSTTTLDKKERETKAERKERRAKKKASKRKREEDDDDDPVVAVVEEAEVVPISALDAILKNPRMAARSKHLRAKRMASSSNNAAAMAEILGIAPPTSASASPSTSGFSTPLLSSPSSFSPAPTMTTIRSNPLLNHDIKGDNGWPVVPNVRTFPSFASSSSNTIAATFVSSSTTTIAAMMEVEPVVVVEEVGVESEVEETEKQKLKREKSERKELRQQKKDKRAPLVNDVESAAEEAQDDDDDEVDKETEEEVPKLSKAEEKLARKEAKRLLKGSNGAAVAEKDQKKLAKRLKKENAKAVV